MASFKDRDFQFEQLMPGNAPLPLGKNRLAPQLGIPLPGAVGCFPEVLSSRRYDARPSAGV